MFGNDHHDMVRYLDEVEYWARQKANFHQAEARQLMAKVIANDIRFAGFDAERVAAHAQHSKTNGSILDLTDTQLQKGGQPRPLDRWR